MSNLTSVSPRGLRQPYLGLAGLLFVVLAVAFLGYFPSRPGALTTTITAITFGLPVLIVCTLWWNGWPFASLKRGAGGWARFLFLVVTTFALTVVGQVITGRMDLGGVFGAADAFPIFPYAFVLAAGIFVTMLHFTFVTRKAPFARMGPVSSGVAALLTSWLIGLAMYFFLLNWEVGDGRPPAPPFAGTGPIYALDWPPVLLCICVVQMLGFVLLKGEPFVRITNSLLHFIVVTVFTIGGGLLLHWALIAVGLSGTLVAALAGAVTAAVILIEILFGGWPFGDTVTLGRQGARLVAALVLGVVIYLLLSGLGAIGYASIVGAPPVDLWVAGVSLNLIAAFSIVHAAVFGRWPLTEVPNDPPEPESPSHTAAEGRA